MKSYYYTFILILIITFSLPECSEASPEKSVMIFGHSITHEWINSANNDPPYGYEVYPKTPYWVGTRPEVNPDWFSDWWMNSQLMFDYIHSVDTITDSTYKPTKYAPGPLQRTGVVDRTSNGCVTNNKGYNGLSGFENILCTSNTEDWTKCNMSLLPCLEDIAEGSGYNNGRDFYVVINLYYNELFSAYVDGICGNNPSNIDNCTSNSLPDHGGFVQLYEMMQTTFPNAKEIIFLTSPPMSGSKGGNVGDNMTAQRPCTDLDVCIENMNHNHNYLLSLIRAYCVANNIPIADPHARVLEDYGKTVAGLNRFANDYLCMSTDVCGAADETHLNDFKTQKYYEKYVKPELEKVLPKVKSVTNANFN